MAQIVKPKGATTRKRIVGRGPGSRGGASGRGHGGQNSRSGGGTRPGFEGGQMPLYRKVARRGFSNYPFKKEYSAVSLSAIEKKFNDGETVDVLSLKKRNVVKGKSPLVKILANGEITKKVKVEGLKVSAKAAEKIKAAGGEIS